MTCRSDGAGWWRLPANPLVWGALLALVGLQWLAVSGTPLTRLLGTALLAVADWLAVGVAVLWPVLVMEAVTGWGRAASLGHGDPTRGATTPGRDVEITRNP